MQNFEFWALAIGNLIHFASSIIGKAKITAQDFGHFGRKKLANFGNCQNSNCVALAIGNPIHFARPIMGDANFRPQDFGV